MKKSLKFTPPGFPKGEVLFVWGTSEIKKLTRRGYDARMVNGKPKAFRVTRIDGPNCALFALSKRSIRNRES